MEQIRIIENLRNLEIVATDEELNALSARWAYSCDLLVRSTLDLLNAVKVSHPKINYRLRKDCAVSAYCVNRLERERECFHISVLIRKPKLTIYQHGEADDKRKLFNIPQQSNPSIRHGHLSEETIIKDDQIMSYVQNVLEDSYTRLTRS